MSSFRPDTKLDRTPRPWFAQGWFARPYDFLARDVWSVRIAELPLPKRMRYRAGRVLYLAARGFLLDQIGFRAAALTYISVLSLVPLLAFSFSVVKGLGYYEQLVAKVIDPALDRTFGERIDELGQRPLPQVEVEAAPGERPGEPMALRRAIERVLDFVEETDFQTLGGLGLAILLYAVIRLLNTVEASFNAIWGVKRPRSPVRKVSDYLTMVVVTPIFLLTAITLTTALEEFAATLHVQPLFQLLLRLAPVLAAFVAFVFFYMVLPNTRTRVVSAMIGALVAALLWQAALVLHVKFQVGIARYNAIYSSFAAVPIFLVWVNVSWTIVMVGAEVAYAHQNEHVFRKVAGYREYGHALRERVALRAMTRICGAFLRGERPQDAESMAEELGIPLQPLEDVLALLRQQGLILPVEPVDEGRHLPAKDPARITVQGVLEALKQRGVGREVVALGEVDREVDRLTERMGEELAGSAYNLSLRDLALSERGERASGVVGEARPQPS